MTDLRGKLGPARDQGARGTCVAFACSSVTDVVFGDVFSAEFLARCALSIDRADDENKGVSLNAGGEALVRLGQPLEGDWPYNPIASVGDIPLRVFRYARPYKSKGQKTTHGVDERLLTAELSRGLLIVIGIRVFDDFLMIKEPDTRLDAPQPGTNVRGLHAVSVVGDVGERRKYRWIIRNSWGPSWGSNGYALASSAFLRECVIETLSLEV